MANKLQLKDLQVGSIISDATNSTKYILLETQYNITDGRISDGVLLGFYSNGEARYFSNKVFDSDSQGNVYKESTIRQYLDTAPAELGISEKLNENIIATMIGSRDTIYDVILAKKLFLPSLIELGSIPDHGDAIIVGVAINTENEKVKSYIQALKTAKVLTRNSYERDVYLADNTKVNMGTGQNMSYFLCLDPTLYIGLDEEGNYYLFDNFVNSKTKLNEAIQDAERMITEYKDVPEFRDLIDFLKELVDKGKNVSDKEYQAVVDQITQDILDAISTLEVKVSERGIEESRVEQNVAGINELIKKIDDFLFMLSINGYMSTMPNIEQDVNDLTFLKNDLTNKVNRLSNGTEAPVDAIEFNRFLDSKYEEYFALENSVNQKIFTNNSFTELITQLGGLVQECTILIKNYPLIENSNLQTSIDNANRILSTDGVTNTTLQKSILDLSARKQEFLNSVKFEVDETNPVLEIGLFGRRPAVNVVLTNNITPDVVVTSSDENIVKINPPKILTEVLPLGISKQYTLLGVAEGEAIVTFTPNSSLTREVNEPISIAVTVSTRDTMEPNYLDLIEDRVKVSIQQIDSGVKDLPHLGSRLELIEQKLLNSSTTLDTDLLNILNTTTPFPIANNIETILVKDADIVSDLPTVINLSNSYYIGKHHLMVYRNGVYQQLNVRYKEKTNNSVEFSPNYLLPGDRLLFVSGSSGLNNLTNITVEYTDSGLLEKIKFYQGTEVFREIRYVYDDKPQIIEQIISDELFEFIKTFTYNEDNLVSDITIEIVKKETGDSGS